MRKGSNILTRSLRIFNPIQNLFLATLGEMLEYASISMIGPTR
jgi:hypothetical protein